MDAWLVRISALAALPASPGTQAHIVGCSGIAAAAVNRRGLVQEERGGGWREEMRAQLRAMAHEALE